jgi:transposase-like protein
MLNECLATRTAAIDFRRGIISHSVWLYFRFGVSFRDVEELMAARGVLVSYETVRRWCEKFGQAFAAGLRKRRPRTGDKWHLGEVFLKINGVTHYVWRAVDQHGVVLDILVQPKLTDSRPCVSFAGGCGPQGIGTRA